MYIHTRIKRALRGRTGLRNDIYIERERERERCILRQICYDRYIMAYVLRQIYYSRFLMADK